MLTIVSDFDGVIAYCERRRRALQNAGWTSVDEVGSNLRLNNELISKQALPRIERIGDSGNFDCYTVDSVGSPRDRGNSDDIHGLVVPKIDGVPLASVRSKDNFDPHDALVEWR
jgi:hypothetical protein